MRGLERVKSDPKGEDDLFLFHTSIYVLWFRVWSQVKTDHEALPVFDTGKEANLTNRKVR